jgi:hypothetical protein
MNQVVWATKATPPGERAKDDFYATPAECVVALLPHIEDFPDAIWEPACGDGAISKVLMTAHQSVFSSDIVDRGYPFALTKDFLKEEVAARRFGIVTNPPYKHAEAFIRQAFELGCTHIAMLLKSNFWHARRGDLFEQHTPSEILPLTWRPDFTGGGSPFLDVAWNIWRPGCSAARVTRLVRRPR